MGKTTLVRTYSGARAESAVRCWISTCFLAALPFLTSSPAHKRRSIVGSCLRFEVFVFGMTQRGATACCHLINNKSLFILTPINACNRLQYMILNCCLQIMMSCSEIKYFSACSFCSWICRAANDVNVKSLSQRVKAPRCNCTFEC